MMQIVLIGIGAGLAAALLFVSPLSGTLLALPLFALSGLPIAIAGLGWGSLSAAIAAVGAAGDHCRRHLLSPAAIIVFSPSSACRSCGHAPRRLSRRRPEGDRRDRVVSARPRSSSTPRRGRNRPDRRRRSSIGYDAGGMAIEMHRGARRDWLAAGADAARRRPRPSSSPSSGSTSRSCPSPTRGRSGRRSGLRPVAGGACRRRPRAPRPAARPAVDGCRCRSRCSIVFVVAVVAALPARRRRRGRRGGRRRVWRRARPHRPCRSPRHHIGMRRRGLILVAVYVLLVFFFGFPIVALRRCSASARPPPPPRPALRGAPPTHLIKLQRRNSMEVILLERIARLGQMGDVVRVRDGYARNFLLPQGKALRATEANRKRFEARARPSRGAQSRSQAAKPKRSPPSSTASPSSSSARPARPGSSTARSRPATLPRPSSAGGFTVARSQVALNQPIKTIGLHTVAIALHPEVDSTVTVNVARSEDEATRQARGEDLTRADRGSRDRGGPASRPRRRPKPGRGRSRPSRRPAEAPARP